MAYWKNTKKLRCPFCNSIRLVKNGIVSKRQRYLCRRCEHTTVIPKGGKKNA